MCRLLWEQAVVPGARGGAGVAVAGSGLPQAHRGLAKFIFRRAQLWVLTIPDGTTSEVTMDDTLSGYANRQSTAPISRGRKL